MPLSSPAQLDALLARSRIIAVVGLSDRPERPSHEVAAYLQAQGYRIIPVNPSHAGQRILGELCYPDLHAAAAQQHIDIVDCFRRTEHIAPLAQAAIAIGAGCLWLQLGIVHAEAARSAEQAGLAVVMDKCLKIEHALRAFPERNSR